MLSEVHTYHSRYTIQDMMGTETAETEQALSSSHHLVCLVHSMKSIQLTVLTSSGSFIGLDFFVMILLCEVNDLCKCMRSCLAAPLLIFFSSIASAVYGCLFD